VGEIKSRLPELPEARRRRFMEDFGLSFYDADLLTVSRAQADFFEECMGASTSKDRQGRAKALANWILGDLAHLLHEVGLEIEESPITPRNLNQLEDLVEGGTISLKMAREVLPRVFESGAAPAEVVQALGLVQISDRDELSATVARVVSSAPQAVADYKAGKAQAITYLVGQVMKETKGRANPALVNSLLKEQLDAS
jgi:aspartyl-tRNA(Asn)/glutamyl-tRNA(Gln) amidotransferase subunit B